MGNHGWGGRPPATDEEARQRIIDATACVIDRRGVAKTSLSDVATELGVTRQTVYRHLGSLNTIVGLVAWQGAESFVDRMIEHLEHVGVDNPAEAVVEGFLFCLRTVPDDPRLSLLLQLGDAEAFSRTATAPDILAYGAEKLRRFPVDWDAGGVLDADLAGLAEMILRLLISMLQNPFDPPRPEADARAFLERWLAPALRH
jgi:AcrR family transcriptional regulator